MDKTNIDPMYITIKRNRKVFENWHLECWVLHSKCLKYWANPYSRKGVSSARKILLCVAKKKKKEKVLQVEL